MDRRHLSSLVLSENTVKLSRRRASCTVSAVFATGCAGTRGESTTHTPGESDTPETTATASSTPSCVVDAVSRPEPRIETTPRGDRYPDPPAEPIVESVRQYLITFETAFARNRTIRDQRVSSVSVSVEGGFDVSEVESGFRGSGNVRIPAKRRQSPAIQSTSPTTSCPTMLSDGWSPTRNRSIPVPH